MRKTKKNEKNEIKNKISMALKDPILQQGFEIICKNLTDLKWQIKQIIEDNDYYQKENAELKKQLTEEQNLNAEIKARFVKCNTCTEEMKKDCLMWTENLCQGERCNELIDIQELIMKGGMIS